MAADFAMASVENGLLVRMWHRPSDKFVPPERLGIALNWLPIMGEGEGRDLTWPWLPIDEFNDILNMAGGVADGGAEGWIQCQDYGNDGSALDTYGKYTCVFYTPIAARIKENLRMGITMEVRNMIRVDDGVDNGGEL